MKTRFSIFLGIVVCLALLPGCFFNVFQTAKMVGAGNIGMMVGVATLTAIGEEEGAWFLTPQARVSLGLSDTIEVGVRSGAMIDLDSRDTEFLGVVGDAKFLLFHRPGSFSLATGFGLGYSRDASVLGTLGWGLEGSIYFDYDRQLLPMHIVYRPLVSLGGEGVNLVHQLAAGLCLNLTSNLRLLFEVDYKSGMVSGGMAVEMKF